MKERLLCECGPAKVFLRTFVGDRHTGRSDHIAFEVGPFRLDFQRAVGMYGYRHTVSYAAHFYRLHERKAA